jgi:hypothetical protein
MNDSRMDAGGPSSAMPRRDFLGMVVPGSAIVFFGGGVMARAERRKDPDEAALDIDQESMNQKEGEHHDLNPNTRWMLEAKWGLFSHFLPRLPGATGKLSMTAEEWNRRVDAFDVAKLVDQLAALKVPYFFLTVGSLDGFFCSPNAALGKLGEIAGGAASKRDLIAELAAGLGARGIRMGVSLPVLGEGADREKYLPVIEEWSLRWGKAISAWWIDHATLPDEAAYAALTAALKAGNPDALLAFNTGPLKLTYRLQEPPTEREDFFAGQVDYYLPTCAVRSFDKRKFWVGPNFHGSLVHFITFLGANWGTGDPRFPDDLVKGWTRHTNNYSGTVTWDVPLDESGMIAGAHLRQIKALSDYISA